MDWMSLMLLLFIGFLVYSIITRQKPEDGNLPPGPRGLPLLGYILFMKPTLSVALMELRKKYGDVFCVPILNQTYFVISSMDLIREALIEKGDIFSGRPKSPFITYFTKNRGIIFPDGQIWREHRRFALRSLRNLGLGKDILQNTIHQEVSAMWDTVDRQKKGDSWDTCKLFMCMTANVISRTILNERLASDDPENVEVIKGIEEDAEGDTGIIQWLPKIFPRMLWYPWIMKWFTKVSKRARSQTVIKGFIRKRLQNRLATDDGIVEPRDFLDSLILHQKSLEAKGNDHTFDEQALVQDTFDFTIAGGDTSRTVLCWGCLLLALHSDIQERARAEIVEQIGDRMPGMQDHPKLNYTLAVIDEILRYSTVIPTSLAHRAIERTTVGGYDIPKDSIILPFLYGVHRDSRYWTYPNDFNPLNFMDSDGHYKSSDYLIPFSKGKRACVGENLARMDIFITLVSMLQRYRLSVANRELMDVDELLLGDHTFVRQPNDHRIFFSRLSDDI